MITKDMTKQLTEEYHKNIEERRLEKVRKFCDERLSAEIEEKAKAGKYQYIFMPAQYKVSAHIVMNILKENGFDVDMIGADIIVSWE